jgi:capsular polysaccharide biosynthesis protein/cellulose biosynthesis protein BcsQ
MQVTQINPNGWRNPEPPTSPLLPLRPTSKGVSLMHRASRSLRVHWLTFAVVSIALLAGSAAFLLRYKPSYAATSYIYVSPTFPKTLNEDPETAYPYDSYMEQQVHTITRYDVLADAIRSLPAGVWRNPGEPEASAVARLARMLTVARVETTFQLEISLMGRNPDHLAEIVNAVTTSYLNKAKEEEFYGRDQRLATLRDARDEIEKELDQTLLEQAGITRKLGVTVIGTGDGTNPYDDELNRVRADYANAHQQRIEAQAKLQALQTSDPASPTQALDAEADAQIANDPQLTSVKTALGSQLSSLMTQASDMKEDNPVRKQLEEKIAQTDAGLKEVEDKLRREAAAKLEDRTHSEVLRTGLVEASLQNELQKDSAMANSAAPRFQRADQLKAEIDRLQARYTQVDDRIDNLELESSSPGTAHLFSAAMTPIEPEPSKVKMLAPFLVPFIFLIGLCAAMTVDYLDPRVYTTEDLEGVLGFAPIGSLFADKDVTQLVYDEGVLRLAAAIDHSTRVAGVRTFVMTATDDKGQTSPVLENLAHALAGLGRKVITIDASGNANPVAYASVELNDGSLASRHLAVSPPQPSMVRPTPQGSAVSAQSLPSRIAPLPSFVSDAFQKLTNDYEIVLIDTAPLTCSAETEYLARCADVTILVATAAKTTKARLARAARLLERIDVPGVAAIISEVSLLRVNKTTRNDVREFEARTDASNLRWKPKFTPFVVGAAYCKEDAEQPGQTAQPPQPAGSEEPVAGLG